jgi:hypothetical protein
LTRTFKCLDDHHGLIRRKLLGLLREMERRQDFIGDLAEPE